MFVTFHVYRVTLKYHLKENHKELSEIVIGSTTTEAITFDAEHKVFLSSVISYFKTSCDYIIHKFPLNYEVLINAEVADLDKIESLKFSSAKFFINSFPCMLYAKETAAEAVDELGNRFCSLQIGALSDITSSSKCIDAQWVEVGDIKGASGHPKYKQLSDVMSSILLIPHSKAECEKIFSVVKKNQNEFRSTLLNKTFESLLIMKTHNSKKCFEQVFTQEFLNKAKRSTIASLNSAVE